MIIPARLRKADEGILFHTIFSLTVIQARTFMSGGAELDKEFHYGQNRHNHLGTDKRREGTDPSRPEKRGRTQVPGSEPAVQVNDELKENGPGKR
jgi:hypothetical protein